MKKLVIFSSQTCPFGDAGAIRLHYLGKLFQLQNFDVTIVGIRGFSQESFINCEKIDSINYYYFREHNRYYLYQLKKYLLDKHDIDAILVYTIPILAFIYLKRYAEKNKIHFLHDSVEWYSPDEFKIPWLSYEYLRKELYNRILIDKKVSVIAISRYLYSHFKSKGINTVRIPVIMNTKKNIFKEKYIDTNYVSIAYIGGYVPQKDQIDLFVKAYLHLNQEEQDRIKLHFIGMDNFKVAKLANVDIKIIENNKNIICYGKVSRDRLLYLLNKIDFTIIIRKPDNRYAKAGFPTKVVESLSCGVPVITNLSSDLSLYLKDEHNSIILNEIDETSIIKILNKVANINFEKRKEMFLKAFYTANIFFDYSSYEKEIIELLENK